MGRFVCGEEMIKLKNLELKNRFFLAPMAEVNDIAFRILCLRAGAGLVYTGMINPLTHKEFDLEDKPALQIFCTSEEGVEEFVKKYKDKVSLFDFNLGCPAKTAKKLGFGSFMHNKLEQIEKILKAIRRGAPNIPLTVKLRKSKEALKIIKIAEKYCDAICIHPRTNEQGYGGKADVGYAEKIKKRTKFPIIYSGDVCEDNAQELAKKFDFLMVGRAAIGNPNIFSILSGTKESKITFFDYLELAKKKKLYFRQIKFQAMCFTKSNERAKDMRREIAKAKTVKELEEVYRKYD